MFKFNVRGVTFQVTDQMMLAILCITMMGVSKIKAIGLYRQHAMCGLVEAKDLVDFIIDNFNLAGGEVHYKNVSSNVSFLGKSSL